MKKGPGSYLAGKQAERRALRFLQGYGLKYLGSNYRAARGEIDLILQDGSTIVFVEVRSRSSNSWMEAIESIDHGKVERLVHAGEQYLQQHGLYDNAPCRFDVITLTGRTRSPKIEWIKNAFEA